MEKEINKRSALIILTAGSFLTPFMGSSVNIALPSIGKEFAMDAVLLTWVSTSFLLGAAMFLVPFGRIADLYGRKRIYTYGIMVYTLAALLSGISVAPWMLISFCILHGIGSSMIFGTGVAILTSIFSAGERGRALGIQVSCVYLGQSLGPFLSGFLIEHWGWRSIFLVNVPIGLIILSMILWKLKGEWVGARGESFDFLGSIIYSLTLVAIMYGFSLLPSMVGGGFLLVGALGFWVFIKWETKTASPVFDIKLFRHNKVFAFSNLAALVHYGATFGVNFLLSLYLQYVQGYSPLQAGSIILFKPAMQAIFSPFAGRLSDKIDPRIVASLGMAFTVVGLFLLIFLHEKTTLAFMIPVLLTLGFGFALFSSPNTNAVMGSVEEKFYGIASGTVSLMRLMGQILSMGIATLIFAVVMGRVEITPEYYPLLLKSTRAAFLIFAILCIGGIFASLARGKVR